MSCLFLVQTKFLFKSCHGLKTFHGFDLLNNLFIFLSLVYRAKIEHWKKPPKPKQQKNTPTHKTKP